MSVTTATIKAKKHEKKIPNWQITTDYIETCNCDFGCPCNFNGFPTYGFCRAIVLFHIKDGSYGEINLEGLDVVYVGSWPKAIHEGDGTLQIYVSKRADDRQRDALVNIMHGQAKGSGPFALFAATLKYILEPQFVDIKAKINGKTSSFSVPGVIDVQVDSFKNPVTGVETDTRITLPKGFIWKEAMSCYTKKMRVVSPNLTFDESGKNAFFVPDLSFKGP
ncbi:MAG: DUF1326 domain-containing protein [Nitrososphaerales archaeon]